MVRVQLAMTEPQQVMADFWCGGATADTPASLWSQFAQVVSARDHLTEENDIKLFFALANALFDAGIAAWDAKRYYDAARPITAVRYVFCDQVIRAYSIGGPAAGLRQIPGTLWAPYQLPNNPTLPFAEYVSGHSTFSAAAAEALKRFTGSDAFNHSMTIAPRSLTLDPALPATPVVLRWDRFSDAACEAGLSRVVAGLHFPQSDLAGRVLGQQVGALAFDKARQYWEGIAA